MLLGAASSSASAQLVARNTPDAMVIGKVGHWQLSKLTNMCILEDHLSTGTHVYLAKSAHTEYLWLGIANSNWRSIVSGQTYTLDAELGDLRGQVQGEGARVAGVPAIKIKWAADDLYSHAGSHFVLAKDGVPLVNTTFYNEDSAFRALRKCADASGDPFEK